MDVAKYIGLFLLKNQSCYIHGLGSIELRRKPATYDGKNLIPSSYEVVVVQANTVDDSLSNFIATNEQISISKASNALKEFTENAKIELQAGKEVPIPSFGGFIEVNEKLHFNTAGYLNRHNNPIPAEKSIPRRDDRKPLPQPAYSEAPQHSYTTTPPMHQAPVSYPQQEEERKKGGIIWWRIILFVLILAALIGGIGFAVKNMLKPTGVVYTDSAKLSTPVLPAPDTLINQAEMSDTTAALIDTNSSITIEPVEPMPAATTAKKEPMESYEVLINSYEEKSKAEKRLRTLKAYGHTVKLIQEDSNTYYIVVPVTAPVSKRQYVLDSMKRFYNPDGVMIY